MTSLLEGVSKSWPEMDMSEIIIKNMRGWPQLRLISIYMAKRLTQEEKEEEKEMQMQMEMEIETKEKIK